MDKYSNIEEASQSCLFQKQNMHKGVDYTSWREYLGDSNAKID